MKKHSTIDELIQASGWRGTATRFAITFSSAAGLYWLPYAYAWYAEHFLDQRHVINERGRTFEFTIIGALLVLLIIYEIVNVIRFLRKSRMARKKDG